MENIPNSPVPSTLNPGHKAGITVLKWQEAGFETAHWLLSASLLRLPMPGFRSQHPPSRPASFLLQFSPLWLHCLAHLFPTLPVLCSDISV